MKVGDSDSNTSGRLQAEFCSIRDLFALVSVKCLGLTFFSGHTVELTFTAAQTVGFTALCYSYGPVSVSVCHKPA